MRLPSVDLELTYWRLRRRTQRLRGVVRDAISRARADAHLRHLHRTGNLPERPQPEDTFAYRALWAVAIVGLLLVLAIDSVGEEAFLREVNAVMTAGQHVAGATQPPTWTADIDALKKSAVPNT